MVNDGRTNPNLLGSNGPFLYIVGRSGSSAETERVVAEAQKLMQKQLLELQNALNAPEKTYVSLVNVVAPSAPEADASRATKLGLMAAGFCFVLTIGIAYFGQRFRARRRARAAVRAAVAGPPPGTDQREPEDQAAGTAPGPERRAGGRRSAGPRLPGEGRTGPGPERRRVAARPRPWPRPRPRGRDGGADQECRSRPHTGPGEGQVAELVTGRIPDEDS